MHFENRTAFARGARNKQKIFYVRTARRLCFTHFFVIIFVIVLALWQKQRISSGKERRANVDRRGWLRVFQGLTWLTQLGLSIAAPIVLCLLGAHWLCGRGAGGWVYVPALVLGIGAGAATFSSFAKSMVRHARKTQKRPPDRP